MSKRILWKYVPRFQEQVRNRYRELSDKKKDMKREYRRNRYQDMSKENKHRLKEYQKHCGKAKKST